MSHMSRLPLPSIALVLTTDHTLIPRRPSVIKLPPSPAPTYSSIEDEVPAPQTDMMKTIRWRAYEPIPLVENCYIRQPYEKRVTFVEDEEPMELIESLYDEPIVESRSVFVRKVLKRKLSNALFTFRQVLCVELPQTCLNKISRQ